MIVFVAGMPRAGSMWTYNVVRELYKHKKYTVLPDKVPVIESELILKTLKSNVLSKQVHCIKTHSNLPNPLPTQHNVKIICNFRDVRDAGLSFMRFMHGDYNVAINAMIGMMQTADYFRHTFADNLLPVRYDTIKNEPMVTIKSICEYLALDVAEDIIIDIEKQFNKSAIKKRIDKFSDVKITEGLVSDKDHQKKYATVENFDGTYRIFDKETSFQSNHITSKKDGEWKDYFTDQQKEQINAKCGQWLIKYGFKI